MSDQIETIAVIGVGVMGSGIAQIAAQSGHVTYLYDAKAGAAEQAKAKLAVTFQKLVEKIRFLQNRLKLLMTTY